MLRETTEYQRKKVEWRFFEQTALVVAAKCLIVRLMVHSVTVFNFQKLNTLRISALNTVLFKNSMTRHNEFMAETP